MRLLRNIESQSDASGRLIDQINASYNNALLVQEIGQATASILDIDRLLTVIIESLEKRLDFDRGMIMLANRNKTRLVYTIGYGYKPEEKAFLEKIEFHLDNPKSRGVFVLTFRKQTPILVNDLSEIEKDLSPRSLEFARRMGTRSFICVPIIFKGESMGVLVVDNIRSKRLLNQSDMSLLMGIAPQIAISISNAMAYRKIMESEKRFRSLSETSPDIIYTVDREGILTYVNPAWQRILGYDCHEIAGKPLSAFLRPEESGLCRSLLETCLRSGSGISDVIGTFIHQDGTDRYLSISGAPNIDSDGKLIGLVGTLKDLTDIILSEARLKDSFEKLQMALNSTVQAISLIVESRDPYTSGHQERVSRLACAIAKEMGLPDDTIASIKMAATLHDVGKINVPAEILSKPKSLSPIERGMIEMHPEVGYNILKSIEFPSPVAKIVFQHHERLDGTGYPAGIRDEEIMLEARILAVADVVEAMASHRPYRAALGMEKTLTEIRENRGILYDEEVVDACFKLFTEKRFAF